MRADDNELIERARQGDLDAYGELVQRYQDQAVAAAYAILADRHEAEDATQEAFTNAYLALGRFREGGSFRAWLLRIVINEARDLLSARQRRVDVLSRAAGGLETLAPAESAEAAALNQRRREALLTALFELPETDRLAVTCRYFLDLPEAEIADILGIARGTVKSRLARALKRLGPILQDLGPFVVVPPVIDLQHAVMQHLGGAGVATAKGGIPKAAISKFWSKAQPAGAFATASVAVILVASMVMLSRGGSAPAAPAPPPPSIVVLGGDLSDAERQELMAAFTPDATATETVSRQELTDTLQNQGMTTEPSDAALSSVQLMCATPGSGLHVTTRNISGLGASEYAAALLTAGLFDGSVIVAAPNGKSVSGETALVGLFKAYPTCTGGSPPDPQRERLAYQFLDVVSQMAATDANLQNASAAGFDILQDVITGQAQDEVALNNIVESSAARDGIKLTDSARSAAAGYFGQLRGLDFGAYARGVVVQENGAEDVRIAARQ